MWDSKNEVEFSYCVKLKSHWAFILVLCKESSYWMMNMLNDSVQDLSLEIEVELQNSNW